MYLSNLKAEGFRCLGKEFSVQFTSELNVIVGEKGAGKIPIISAICLLFNDSESGRKVNEKTSVRLSARCSRV